jgi:hypothetical protein
MKTSHILVLIPLICLTSCTPKSSNPLHTPVSDPVPQMRESFVNPPMESRIRAYWWWLNSYATKESITRDLEEMKAKGFGGALIFDAGSSNYTVALKTKHGPDFGSPEWIELLKHAIRESDRLGLELSLNIQSGWNPGGPSVLPSDAMKKLTFSEVTVIGPLQYRDTLPQPDSLLFYQDIIVQAVPSSLVDESSRIFNFSFKSLNRALGWKGIYPLEKLRDPGPDSLNQQGLSIDRVVDLSKNYRKGILTWEVPSGSWTIIRFGMTCTGAEVSTSSDGWQGLSFDHLSQDAFRKYFNSVVDPIVTEAKAAGNSLKYLYTDSWEMGVANWTENFIEEFRKFRGYDPTPWLPVLSNRVIGSRAESDRFLKDFRKTVGDCIAVNHYELFRDLAHERGMGMHPESGGPHSVPGDALRLLGINDFPMGEYWARSNTHRTTEPERLAVKQSASAAHTYGKRFVAAEGPTSIGPQWERSPRDLKNVIDQVFCSGINRLIWHTFTNSPVEEGIPGIEYFAGTHFNPNLTWWPVAGAFVNYLNRCSYLLSQGLYTADVLYYYGDDVPNFVFLTEEEPDFPYGYNWDKCNREVLMNRLDAKNGNIVLPDGMSYKLLVVRDFDKMDPEVVKKVTSLVKGGANVLKLRSKGSPQLPLKRSQEKVGRGSIYEGYDIQEVLDLAGVEPDIIVDSQREDTKLDYIHRATADSDIYFIVNKWAWDSIQDFVYRYIPATPDRYDRVEITLRSKEGEPELWDPMTGEISMLNYTRTDDGRLRMSFILGPEESKFIVINRFPKIDKSTSGIMVPNGGISVFDSIKHLIADTTYPVELNLAGAEWEIQFDPNWGPKEPLKAVELKSWTHFSEPDIRYYSGSALYRTNFTINNFTPGKPYLIDLGNVQELCELKVNGQMVGVLWFPPFTTDITKFIKSGDNLLEIRVYNLWPNRLIGDGKLPVEERRTRTNVTKFDKPDAEKYLRISGLLGPVRIFTAE